MTAWRECFRSKAASLLPTALAAAVGAVMLLAPVDTENAVANGDTRTIHLHHAHTKESIDATYMVDGRYDPVALEKLNWFLRDWRRDEPTHMDPKLFDTIWEVYRESGSQQPIEVMSAYRSPETNSMLRHATRGVAEHSQHILGKAMDQHYVDVPMSRIRELAMRLQRGGVGFYPTAGTPFVHMDVGGVRHWPRMSYDQLSRLFPDGKTVHIPSNGQPLSGYEEARADLAARGDGFDYPTAGEVKSKGFFAWLFGGGDDEGDGDAARDGGVPRDAAPAPRRRGSTQVASADPVPVGSVVNDGVINSHKGDRPEAGGSFFSLFSSKPAEPAPAAEAPAPPLANNRGPRGRNQVASLPPAQAIDADAQAKLAAEMQRQAEARQQAAAEAQQQAAAEAQKQAAAESERQADPDARRQAPQPAVEPPPPAAPARGVPVLAAATGRDMPLPPRRPVEIAAVGPAAAPPSARPGDAAAGRNDRAPTPGAGRVPVAPPSVRAGLPAAITQGIGQPASTSRALAFAPQAAPAIPLPVTRPPLVAARLDRSNFRTLTGATPADRVAARAGVGSAVAALRPAAKASAASLASDGSAPPRRGFGARATELSTRSFSGSAVTAQERVSTATLHKRAAAATTAD